jgi:hypothetical protein
MISARRKARTSRAAALEKQARKLSATERERLAERLLVHMKHEPLTAVDEAWVVEAEKRFAAWKRKTTKTVSARAALREIRKELRHCPRFCRQAGNPPSRIGRKKMSGVFPVAFYTAMRSKKCIGNLI